MSFLSISMLNKSFKKHHVLKDINLDIKKGEFISLLGYSGCGKSTLLRIIAGLEQADSGKIVFNNNDITNTKASARKFGMVFQSYALFPHMTAYENLAFPLREQGHSKKKIKSIIQKKFELVDLIGNEHKYPRELSGGQQQRVAIARALSLKPKVFLLDEPLSALDAKVRQKLRQDIKHIHKELGITSIMVTHDQEEAITMSDRIAIMNNGEIIQIDSPKEIYTHPKDIFTAMFIGDVNIFTTPHNISLLRPEHVRIQKDALSSDNHNMAMIQDIEFLGSSFKIKLDCLNKTKADVITSNISIGDFNALNLKVGDHIYYSLNQEYMLCYNKNAQ